MPDTIEDPAVVNPDAATRAARDRDPPPTSPRPATAAPTRRATHRVVTRRPRRTGADRARHAVENRATDTWDPPGGHAEYHQACRISGPAAPIRRADVHATSAQVRRRGRPVDTARPQRGAINFCAPPQRLPAPTTSRPSTSMAIEPKIFPSHYSRTSTSRDRRPAATAIRSRMAVLRVMSSAIRSRMAVTVAWRVPSWASALTQCESTAVVLRSGVCAQIITKRASSRTRSGHFSRAVGVTRTVRQLNPMASVTPSLLVLSLVNHSGHESAQPDPRHRPRVRSWSLRRS